MKWQTGWYIIATMLMTGCTVPFRTKTVAVDEYIDRLTSGSRMTSFKGWGDVEVAIDDVRYLGSIDVIKRLDSGINITVYSPLGTEIMSIHSDSGSGLIVLPDSSIYLENQDRMSGLPFSWAETLPFGDFLKLITSRFDRFSSLLQTQPDSCISRKAFSFFWKDSCSELTLDISRNNGRIQEIKYKPERYSDMVIVFNDFSGGISRRIKFYSDDRNYFIIRYEKINTEFQ